MVEIKMLSVVKICVKTELVREKRDRSAEEAGRTSTLNREPLPCKKEQPSIANRGRGAVVEMEMAEVPYGAFQATKIKFCKVKLRGA
jgi:hypothetical protein